MNKTLKKAFKKNSIVDIIAPASLCSPKEIKQSIDYIKQIGLKPRFNSKILKKSKSNLYSQSLSQKKIDIKKALTAKDSNIIWCLRGGYGSFKLLTFLSKIKKPTQKKILIGYSDITALHYLFNHKWKLASLHFSALQELGAFFYKNKKHSPAYNIFLQMIDNKKMEHKNLNLLNPSKLKTKKHLKSVLFGGNLCTLSSLMGSKILNNITKPQGILFLEDVNEPAYKVDRMLYQLKEAGFFKNIETIIFGYFIASPLEQKKIKKILKTFAQDLSIPVLWGLKAGHKKLNKPLAFMSPVCLNFNAKKTSANLVYL